MSLRVSWNSSSSFLGCLAIGLSFNPLDLGQNDSTRRGFRQKSPVAQGERYASPSGRALICSCALGKSTIYTDRSVSAPARAARGRNMEVVTSSRSCPTARENKVPCWTLCPHHLHPETIND